MKGLHFFFITSFRIGFRLFPLIVLGLNIGGWGSPYLAQINGIGQSPQEREFYGNSPGNKEGTILDATNPMDLMNRLRRATAMDNATSPSDAIDSALKALEETDKESSNSL